MLDLRLIWGLLRTKLMIGAAWAINSMEILMLKWCTPIVSSSNLGILGSVPGIEVPYLSASTPGMIGSSFLALSPCADTFNLPYPPPISTFMNGSEKSKSSTNFGVCSGEP